jgi:hypothetical protein
MLRIVRGCNGHVMLHLREARGVAGPQQGSNSGCPANGADLCQIGDGCADCSVSVMVQSFPRNGRRHPGPVSSRKRHRDEGSPSSSRDCGTKPEGASGAWRDQSKDRGEVAPADTGCRSARAGSWRPAGRMWLAKGRSWIVMRPRSPFTRAAGRPVSKVPFPVAAASREAVSSAIRARRPTCAARGVVEQARTAASAALKAAFRRADGPTAKACDGPCARRAEDVPAPETHPPAIRCVRPARNAPDTPNAVPENRKAAELTHKTVPKATA